MSYSTTNKIKKFYTLSVCCFTKRMYPRWYSLPLKEARMLTGCTSRNASFETHIGLRGSQRVGFSSKEKSRFDKLFIEKYNVASLWINNLSLHHSTIKYISAHQYLLTFYHSIVENMQYFSSN